MADDEEAAVERIAKALYAVAVQNVLHDVSQLSIDISAVKNTFIDSWHETDRPCAITIFALVDELICDLTLLHINPSYPQRKTKLFSESGLLPTTNRRIEMLFALNWIASDTYHDLHIMRKIRNAFAHHSGIKHFKATPISGLMTSLRIDIHRYLKPILDQREGSVDKIVGLLNDKAKYYFLVSSCLILRDVALEMLILPVALKHRVHPMTILTAFPEEHGTLREVVSLDVV
jgi:hypothetical protein